jgi:hypothetical protein
VSESDLLDRLLDGVVIQGNCWEWGRSRDAHGYGRLSVNGGPQLTHRLMADAIGLGGDGPDVLHSCDNPPCLNPGHLRRGTMKDNMRDASRKRRFSNQRKTHCPSGHPYSGENLYIDHGRRRCLVCKRATGRKWWAGR